MNKPATIPFRDATLAWAKVAAYSFGGPAGQIAVLHRVVVDEKKWLSEERFLHALSYCMLLPGPEAQQLATYVGWLLHGIPGGLVAGLLFILPGFLAILGLSVVYAQFSQVSVVAAVFFGLKPAVLAIVVEAVVRLKSRTLRGSFATALALAAFVAIFFGGVSFPIIVVAAAALGYLAHRLGSAALPSESIARASPPSVRQLGATVTLWLLIWFIPVLAVLSVTGSDHILVREAAFFSKVAVVTFGGAYAVLSYVAQQAVEAYGWLSAPEMLDGLGLAETTPGPLIMVVEFVGFLAAFRNPGTLHPSIAGTLGALMTTWVTFAPCFLFIFAGAPYVEWLWGHRGLQAALNGIMAAVVGVVLNLAIWFALHVVFTDVTRFDLAVVRLWVPDPGSISVGAAIIAVAALIAVFRYRVDMFTVLGGGALCGLLLHG